MKLYFSPTSPYVRKVMVALHELGLLPQVELVPTAVWAPDTRHGAVNPLGKIPALETAEGEVLFDSPVILDYLDSLHDGQPLTPPPGPARFAALRLQALADGMMDAAVLIRLERQRPAERQSPEWIARQSATLGRALDFAEGRVLDLPTLDVGIIALGCALGYLDLRVPDLDWRAGHRLLADWFLGTSLRPSFAATEPPPA